MRKYHRRSIRFQGYDYSQAGAYFVTVCSQGKRCSFGEIVDGDVRLSDAGKIVADEWVETERIRSEVELDQWVVMPNHIHGIVVIQGDWSYEGRPPCEGRPPVAPTLKSKSIGAVMAGYKSAVTKRVNEIRGVQGAKFWQRNYFEHIIRDEDDMNRIRQYIYNNPAQWAFDKENQGCERRR